MKNFIAKGGIEVTDELVDKWDAQAEKGHLPGTPGTPLTQSQFGRPRIYDEDLLPVTVRLPKSEVKALKRIAKKEKQPFSVILRRLLRQGLEKTRTGQEA